MTKEKDLDKLGTVLAMCNDTNKRSLDLLERQQHRQVRMVWASLAVVVTSFLIVGLGMYLTYSAVEDLTSDLTSIVKELHYVQSEENSQELFEQGNSE